MSNKEQLGEPTSRASKLLAKGFVPSDVELRADGEDLMKNSNLELIASRMHHWFIVFVTMIREPIADIQEKRGIPRHQRFTFVDLMSALFNHSYHSCLCIITMIVGMLPLLEGLLNLVRFVLDKALEIDECGSKTEKAIKLCIFFAQLFVIFVMVSLIVTIILLPVMQLIQYALYKIWKLAN